MLPAYIAVTAAKLSSKLIRALNLGKASALPGRVALALNSKILEYYQAQLEAADLQFFVTGTNGKTTSTGLLKQIVLEQLRSTNKPPLLICNDYGANLYYGIVTEFVNSSSLWAQAKSANYVLELDEAASVLVSKVLSPKSITVTNLFRDQLDRFGEIDSTQKLIVKAISNLLNSQRPMLNIVLNADDAKVSAIKDIIEASSNNMGNAKVRNYHFYKVIHPQNQIENFDAQQTQSLIANDQCFVAEVLAEQIGYSDIRLTKANESIELRLNLPGLYNVYNACAAAATAYANGINLETIKVGLENYQGNFGRSETKSINGKNYQLFLIKNPTGCTEVLKYINQDEQARYMIAINDNYADGRDVSWLWDARFEYMHTRDKTIYCSGKRAEDMALRLKYAGINAEQIVIEKDLKQALKVAAQDCSSGEHLYVLPTYTALLELNK